MAFVSRQVLDKWRVRDSWVYRGFAYLFQNKLWQKRVPGGFSTCPYFWMSVFSWVFFKPFIEPAILTLRFIIRGTMKLGGKPIAWWDGLVQRRINRKLDLPCHSGAGLIVSLLLGLLSIVALIVLGIAGYGLCKYYLYAMANGTHFLSILAYGVINLTAVLATSMYNRKNRNTPNRCRVEWYSLSCFIATTIMMSCVYPSLMMDGLKAIGSFFDVMWNQVICEVAGAIWIALCFIGHWGWIGLKWIGFGLGYVLYFCLSLAAITVVFGGFGWILIKIADMIKISENVKVDQERKVTVEDWKSLVTYILGDSNSQWIGATVYDFPRDNDRYSYTDIHEKRYDAVRVAIAQKMVRLFVDSSVQIPAILVSMPYSKFEKVRDLVYGQAFKKRDTMLNVVQSSLCLYDKSWGEAFDDMRRDIFDHSLTLKLTELFPRFSEEYRRDIANLNRAIEAEIEAEHEAWERAQAAKRAEKNKRNEMCLKITGFLNAVYEGVGNILSFIFVRGLYRGVILKIWRAICFLASQIWTFLVYMGITLWELKKGACPYLMFVDELPKPEPVKEEKKP